MKAAFSEHGTQQEIVMTKEEIDAGNAVIIILPIKEYDDYAGLLTGSDIDYLSGISSPARKAAGAAWRAAVRSKLGMEAEINYNAVGAPAVAPVGGTRYQIGVSHSRRFAAVIISKDPCAIDIEDTGRNFERIAGKYISPEESAMPDSSNPLFRAAVWCAKETLYKISGRTGLDLIRDLRILSSDIESGTMTGAVRSEEGVWREYHMKLLRYAECLVVYTCG